MKKLSLFLFIFLQLLMPVTINELFGLVKKYNLSITPQKFSAEINGDIIKRQIKNIPKNMIIFKKKPVTIFKFQQSKNIKVVIKNVEDFYKNLFSLYEDIFNKSGLFLGINKYTSYAKFRKDFEIKSVVFKNKIYTVRLNEQEALPGDYAIYKISERGELIKSIFFNNNKKIMELEYTFKKIKKYKLISFILIYYYEKNKMHKTDLIFTDYKIIK